MFKNKAFITVIITILFAIILPMIFSGYSAARRAEAEFVAQDYASAAKSFKTAAQLLVWRDDLWEKAAISFAKNGDFVKAIESFQHVSVYSETGWAWLGRSYIKLNEPDMAIAALKQGAQIYDSPNLYQLLALVYHQQKNWNAERSALENQIRLDEDNAYAHYRLGLVLTIVDPEHALSDLMRAASLNPESDSVVQALRSALNLSATQLDESQQMVTIGRALGLAQEWDLSIAAFEKAIAFNAENAEAWAWLGEAKQQKGEDGIAELDRALALDSTSVVIHGLRALYWNRKENYPQMLEEYLIAAEYDSANPLWQAEIGNVNVKLGDLVAALNAYQHAIELAPTDSTYWRLLASFCAENGVHLEDIGLPAAEKAAQLAPDDALALDVLGLAYFSSGRYSNAEKVLLDVVQRFPDHLSAHLHLAMNYLAQGNSAAAFDQLTYIQSVDVNGAYGEMAKQLLNQYFP